MRFHAEHRFHGSPDAVAAVLSDPGFYAGLQLPDLSLPTVLEHRQTGDSSVVVLRYEFVGSLDSLARRLLGKRRLAWTQEVTVDRSARTGTVTFKAEADPKRLHGDASFSLDAANAVTTRRLSGEIVVAVPIIGPQAERKIMPGLLRRLDIEAEAVEKTLAEEGG
jgi:hypothetical protein